MPQPPFRFGLQIASLPDDGWRERVRRIEEIGLSTLFVPDHFSPQWDPTALMAGAAAVTESLKVGSLVYDVDYRHPVVFAKQSATIQLLSGGRHEFGLGAGWMQTDYEEAGLPYDRIGSRIERLDEALQICRAMWSQEKTSFEGRHYTIKEIAQAAPLPPASQPRVLVGGGGRRVLGLAGRHADIIGINPTMKEGRITNETAADLTPDRTLQKVEWARAAASAAGRDVDALEFNSLVFVVALTDDPSGIRGALAKSSGMSVDEVADCPLFLTGSASEIRERLQLRREKTGISYIVIQGDDFDLVEQFAVEIVEPLKGR